MQRNRPQSERKLIEAVGRIVADEGFDQLGVNKVAQVARVNKILIYRYFGGLPGLIETYLKQRKPVVAAPPIDLERLKTASLEEFFQVCYTYLITEFRLLRADVAAQKFLQANLFNEIEEGSLLASEKEKQMVATIEGLSGIINAKYGTAGAALLISGLTMLTFAAQQKKVMFGIDLQTEEGWSQIEQALADIIRGAYLLTKEGQETPLLSLPDEKPA